MNDNNRGGWGVKDFIKSINILLGSLGSLVVSIAILVGLTLVYVISSFSIAFSNNYTAYGLASPTSTISLYFAVFITFAAGPLILIVFIVRGVRLYKKGNIKSAILSVALPFFAFAYISVVFIGGTNILFNALFNVFYPYTSPLAQKIQMYEYEKLAGDIEVHPTEICVSRNEGEENSWGAWIYNWVIEWRGSIKFPPRNITMSTRLNDPTTGWSLDGRAYVDNRKDNITFSFFPSDGEFHTWKTTYNADFLSQGVKSEISFSLYDEKTRVSGESYYALAVPELLAQKIFSLVSTQEEYKKPLTEAERLVGKTCVGLR